MWWDLILLRVGLTGGIASGKTTVSKLLIKNGIPVIDSDIIARDLVKPGTEALSEIVVALGADVLALDGSLDRGRVGEVVFGDESSRLALENILHPRIKVEQDRWLDARESEGESSVAVVDAALMIESGGWRRFDLLVVVACCEEEQLARTLSRGGLSEEAVRARIASQIPLADKVKYADRVVDNSGTLDELTKEVEALVAWLLEKARE
ncbi:MAG: dephospho-CoA kinase [Nitrospinaceae bacterium]|nr:dephospho-CoA kinase [Nitrospinaceae bacterium]MBT5946698.1 dephospho-CoA kinase [Nitrospinaceae bacterium]